MMAQRAKHNILPGKWNCAVIVAVVCSPKDQNVAAALRAVLGKTPHQAGNVASSTKPRRAALSLALPGRLLQAEQFAKAATIPKSFAIEVCEALVDHGYLVVDPARTFRIICWTSAQFKDLVEACHDLIGLAIEKCMTRIDAAGLYACNP